MKVGKSLQELAAEIERQMESKRDYIAPTNKLEVVPTNTGVALGVPGKGQFDVGPIAIDQIASHTKIPKQYLDRCLAEDKPLAANNIDTWFKKYPAPRMLRMLDGKNRAFLSDRFSTEYDNHDFAEALLPVLLQRKLNIVSCDITEKHLYIKAVDEQLFRDVPVGYKMGDGSHQIYRTCAPVIIAKNSEVGFRRMTLETGVYDSACTNLAWFASGGFKQTHVGVRHVLTDGVDAEELERIMSRQTRKRTAEATWLQVRDLINSAFNEDVIKRRGEQLEETAKRKITKKVDEVMEVTAERFKLNESEKDSVLKHLIEGGSLTQWGLQAAVTRAAQDAQTYDRATEMEYLGGQIIELTRNQWAELAEAA